ncbi:uncharacterized protein V1518DRAFT_44751 [Limtongia smithiae]|uniref:uncharacterized protein n=1 Tax=Limtongia smithiae TaxID=1125753 RepID=UPI0034CFAA2B
MACYPYDLQHGIDHDDDDGDDDGELASFLSCIPTPYLTMDSYSVACNLDATNDLAHQSLEDLLAPSYSEDFTLDPSVSDDCELSIVDADVSSYRQHTFWPFHTCRSACRSKTSGYLHFSRMTGPLAAKSGSQLIGMEPSPMHSCFFEQVETPPQSSHQLHSAISPFTPMSSLAQPPAPSQTAPFVPFLPLSRLSISQPDLSAATPLSLAKHNACLTVDKLQGLASRARAPRATTSCSHRALPYSTHAEHSVSPPVPSYTDCSTTDLLFAPNEFSDIMARDLSDLGMKQCLGLTSEGLRHFPNGLLNTVPLSCAYDSYDCAVMAPTNDSALWPLRSDLPSSTNANLYHPPPQSLAGVSGGRNAFDIYTDYSPATSVSVTPITPAKYESFGPISDISGCALFRVAVSPTTPTDSASVCRKRRVLVSPSLQNLASGVGTPDISEDRIGMLDETVALSPKRQKSSKENSSLSGLYQCNECSKSFTRRENLKPHEALHAASRGEKKACFVCPSCKKEYSRSKDMKRHMKGHDPNQRRYKCSFQQPDGTIKGCGKHYRRMESLKRHLLSSTSTECKAAQLKSTSALAMESKPVTNC